jgi:ABC-type multidrug transport system fused ATPase/permease subunit
MKQIAQFTKPYILSIIVATLASTGCAVTNVFINDILKLVIDATVNKNLDNTASLLIKGIIVIITGMLSNYLAVYMTGYYSVNILKDIRTATIRHLPKLSPDYVEKNNMVLSFAIYLLLLSPLLCFSTMFPLIILVPLSVKLMKPIKKRSKDYSRMLGETNNNIQELCDGISVVKTYNLEKQLTDKYEFCLKKSLDLSLRNDKLQYNIEPISYMIMTLPMVICLGLGGYLTLKDQMTLGSLVAFVSMLKILIDPLIRAYQLFVNSKVAIASAERVFSILQTPIEIIPKFPKKINFESEAAFELENISFSYEAEKNVLLNINLLVKRNQKIALVGSSGSGKSTLLKLIYKNYLQSSGTLKFFGYDYDTINPNELRNQISLISQDSFIFPLSVADNIRIGKANASIEEIIDASKKAYCHDFIINLPNGYDTLVGEKGTLLSGGQVQRIAIARAILKDSKVLLLDEPTSALDTESEHLVNTAIEKLSPNKTLIVVAHRLPTITNSDEIIVMEQGKIIERGIHTELINLNGTYADLYKAFRA